jgi:rhodanese-related sulfurtransferase
MAAINLVSAAEAHAHVQGGNALLVCAYDSDEKFNKAHLDGAISLSDFQQRSGSIPKDQEIIFYCG